MQTVCDILDYLTQEIIRTRCNLELLQILRGRIAAANGLTEPVASVPSVPSVPSVIGRAVRRVAKPAKAARVKSGPTVGRISDRVVAVVAGSEGQITVKSLADSLPGITSKQIGVVLCRLKTDGKLAKVGYGAYTKTAKFTGRSTKEANYQEFRAGLDVKVPEVQLKSPEARSKAV